MFAIYLVYISFEIFIFCANFFNTNFLTTENDNSYTTVRNVVYRSIQERVNFAKYVVSRVKEDVIEEFGTILESSNKTIKADKIFYSPVGNFREWLLLDSQLLYCVYCVCCDNNNLSKNVALANGVDYNQPAYRLKQHLTQHEKSKLHSVCKHEYLKAVSPDPVEWNYDDQVSKNREILKSIIRVIIFSATHGM